MASIKKNFAYNATYQILVIILPLITAPYVSRVLDAKGIGIYSYTFSITSYFLLFAMLGISTHGNRSIAATKKTKEELSKCFINNYIIQFVVSITISLIYFLYVVFIVKENKVFALIQLLVVVSAVFDINWFFWGLEKFEITVIRNTVCKVLSVICIFIFVNKSTDLWKYVLIMSGTTFISQVILWRYLAKEIKLSRPNWCEVKKNIKPILILFLPILSYSLYRIMDKIMIGSFSSMVELGYYENAEKILNIPIGLVTALGNVMLPRISSLLAEGDINTQKRYMKLSMMFVSIVEGSLCFGISAVASVFVPVYYGNEFIKTGNILSIIIFSALISGWANVIRTQYLIPARKDKVYVISMLIAACVNCVSNLIFIPQHGAMGAVIGTILAEIVVLLTQTIAVRREISIVAYIKGNYAYIVIGIITWVGVKILNTFLNYDMILKLIIEISIGGIIYVTLTFLYCFFSKNEIYLLFLRMFKRKN